MLAAQNPWAGPPKDPAQGLSDANMAPPNHCWVRPWRALYLPDGNYNDAECHSEGSLGGRSDPAEIEGAMAANMAF